LVTTIKVNTKWGLVMVQTKNTSGKDKKMMHLSGSLLLL
jgi:hypothetical protein